VRLLHSWRCSSPGCASSLPRACTSFADEAVSIVAGEKTLSHVFWGRLVEVEVVTTSGGPWAEDVFFCPKDETGALGIVPHALASELLRRVLRLPGSGPQKPIVVMGSTSEARFVCWKGRPGEALVAARPSPEEDVPAK
jgi:hypothetical protein